MDPNETLRLAREALQRGDNAMAAYYLHTLDEWLSNDGFYPAAWNGAAQGQFDLGYDQGRRSVYDPNA
jgi:hypothetical protein